MQPMQPSAKPKKKPTAAGILLTAMIIAGVVLVVALVAWLVLSFRTSSDTGQTLAGAAAVIETAPPSVETIESSLGVSVPFNTREHSGFAYADEVTYTAGDVGETRPYSVIRVRPVETNQASRSEITMASPELRITTSLDQKYWEQFEGKRGYEDLSQIDTLVQENVSQRESDRWVEASDVETRTIGDIEYKKVVFTSENEAHGITSVRREDCYMTVQHDRPYVACINNIRSGNFSVLPQLETVLEQVSYQQPDEDELIEDIRSIEAANRAMYSGEDDDEVAATDGTSGASDDEDFVEVEEVTDEEDAPQEAAPAQRSAQIPPYLEDSADFYAYSRAAPSVVRVGMIYCADIRLTLATGGEGPLLTGACVEQAGTGFFVSSNGLIATSASVTDVKPQDAITSYIINAPGSGEMYQRLDRVLEYMVDSRILMQTDADAIVAGVQERNQDIVEKVASLSARIAPEDIAITSENSSYAVQLQDRPMVINERGNGSLEFAYSDNVISAELEGSRYTTNRTQQQVFNGETVADDIALLQVEQNTTYPALPLASDVNIPEGTGVNVIGMPMYAVGSLSSGQLRSVPMLRQGAADEVFTGSNQQRLLSIKTGSHAGLAGAPALNRSGQVIGLATYNNLNCPNLNCFGGTILRDTAEIGNLARSRNISLQPGSVTADTWNRALHELIKGNYKEATDLFNTAGRQYPQNHLAAPFANYATSQIGSASDTSTANMLVRVMQIVALIAGLLLLLLVVARIMLKVFVKPQYKTQYGPAAAANGSYVDVNQWRSTARPSQQQSAQAPYQPQTPAPQQYATYAPQSESTQTPAPQQAPAAPQNYGQQYAQQQSQSQSTQPQFTSQPSQQPASPGAPEQQSAPAAAPQYPTQTPPPPAQNQ